MAKAAKRLFICLDNAGYEVSLERLKIYVALPDAKAQRTGFLRIVDESGEDYLYPSQRFVAAELPVNRKCSSGRRARIGWRNVQIPAVRALR
jgi:hypothetical protein